MNVTSVKGIHLWHILLCAAAIGCLGARPALSEESWAQLDGNAIRSALTGRSVVYEGGAEQTFDESGQTSYIAGRPSLGAWAVRGDYYCSVWPPSDLWSCYSVESDGDHLRFVGERGDITTGWYKEHN